VLGVKDMQQPLERSCLTESSAMSVPKMPKEKVKVNTEKQSVLIKGAFWTLVFRKVKTKEGKTMFLFKPLELKYSEKTKQFYYQELKGPIWLEKEDIDKIIGALIELTEENATQLLR